MRKVNVYGVNFCEYDVIPISLTSEYEFCGAGQATLLYHDALALHIAMGGGK